jgi:hypothetical protein
MAVGRFAVREPWRGLGGGDLWRPGGAGGVVVVGRVGVNRWGRMCVNLLGGRNVVRPAQCFGRPYAWRDDFPTRREGVCR